MTEHHRIKEFTRTSLPKFDCQIAVSSKNFDSLQSYRFAISESSEEAKVLCLKSAPESHWPEQTFHIRHVQLTKGAVPTYCRPTPVASDPATHTRQRRQERRMVITLTVHRNTVQKPYKNHTKTTSTTPMGRVGIEPTT